MVIPSKFGTLFFGSRNESKTELLLRAMGASLNSTFLFFSGRRPMSDRRCILGGGIALLDGRMYV